MGTSHRNEKQLAIKLQEKGFLYIEKDKEHNRMIPIVHTNKIKDIEEKTF